MLIKLKFREINDYTQHYDVLSWPSTFEDIFVWPYEHWNVHLGARTWKGTPHPQKRNNHAL